MKASKHLEIAERLAERMAKHLAPINEKLAKLMGPSGDDAFITFQPGDGPVVTWGLAGFNSRINSAELDCLLVMDYDEAVDFLERRTI